MPVELCFGCMFDIAVVCFWEGVGIAGNSRGCLRCEVLSFVYHVGIIVNAECGLELSRDRRRWIHCVLEQVTIAACLCLQGTLFLWVFWPSFNSVLAVNKSKAIYNTYFALAVSAVTAFVLSVLTTKDGKFRMTHIHSAVLAGGIAVGYAEQSIEYPWIAMILGLLASVITILGSCCLQRCLYPALKIHDSSGVHFIFGLPGVLGALAQVVLLIIKNWTNLPRLGYLFMIHVGTFCLTISVALITGFITGLILNLKLFKTIPVSKYFEDQFYWEFPRLAVGF